MGKLVAIGHRRPGRPMVTRYDRAFFGEAPVGRITPQEDEDRLIDLMNQCPPLEPAPAEPVSTRRPLSERIIAGFLIFTFGVLAGYLWAAAAYGKLGIS